MQRASDVVGAEVRAHRTRRRWTRAQLSERCADLGAGHITESVLVNIESGRRDSGGVRRRDVTIDEVLILAEALGLSPERLYAPENEVATPADGFMKKAIKEATREWLDRNGPDLFSNPDKENQ